MTTAPYPVYGKKALRAAKARRDSKVYFAGEIYIVYVSATFEGFVLPTVYGNQKYCLSKFSVWGDISSRI